MIRTSLLAAIALAVMAMPVQAGPVKNAAKGVVQTGKSVVKGTGTVLKKAGKGVVCVVTLGNRC